MFRRVYYQQQVFSIQELAIALSSRLDRDKIFPPSYYNQPRDFIVVDTQQRFCVKSNSFLFCCKNVKEEANRCGNGNMRIINTVSGIYWTGATNEEKDVYRNLYVSTKNLCSQMNVAVQPQQPLQPVVIQPPNPIYELMSNMYNTGFQFNTTEAEEFSSMLDVNSWPTF